MLQYKGSEEMFTVVLKRLTSKSYECEDTDMMVW